MTGEGGTWVPSSGFTRLLVPPGGGSSFAVLYQRPSALQCCSGVAANVHLLTVVAKLRTMGTEAGRAATARRDSEKAARRANMAAMANGVVAAGLWFCRRLLVSLKSGSSPCSSWRRKHPRCSGLLALCPFWTGLGRGSQDGGYTRRESWRPLDFLFHWSCYSPFSFLEDDAVPCPAETFSSNSAQSPVRPNPASTNTNT